jgi:hypothetical protein
MCGPAQPPATASPPAASSPLPHSSCPVRPGLRPSCASPAKGKQPRCVEQAACKAPAATSSYNSLLPTPALLSLKHMGPQPTSARLS